MSFSRLAKNVILEPDDRQLSRNCVAGRHQTQYSKVPIALTGC